MEVEATRATVMVEDQDHGTADPRVMVVLEAVAAIGTTIGAKETTGGTTGEEDIKGS